MTETDVTPTPFLSGSLVFQAIEKDEWKASENGLFISRGRKIIRHDETLVAIIKNDEVGSGLFNTWKPFGSGILYRDKKRIYHENKIDGIQRLVYMGVFDAWIPYSVPSEPDCIIISVGTNAGNQQAVKVFKWYENGDSQLIFETDGLMYIEPHPKGFMYEKDYKIYLNNWRNLLYTKNAHDRNGMSGMKYDAYEDGIVAHYGYDNTFIIKKDGAEDRILYKDDGSMCSYAVVPGGIYVQNKVNNEIRFFSEKDRED